MRVNRYLWHMPPDVNIDAMVIDHRLLSEMLDYLDQYSSNELPDQTVLEMKKQSVLCVSAQKGLQN